MKVLNDEEAGKVLSALAMAQDAEWSWHMQGTDRPQETCNLCRLLREAIALLKSVRDAGAGENKGGGK